MTALSSQHLDRPASDVPLPALLNKLRFLSASCRAAARLDLSEACAMLAPDRETAAEAYAMALMRTLSQALGHRPVIRAPGAEPSFDELWLMRLIERAHACDDDSISFLIMRRIPPNTRHTFLPIINGLARNLPEL